MFERRSRRLAPLLWFAALVGPVFPSIGQVVDAPRTAVDAIDEYERKGRALVSAIPTDGESRSLAASAAELTTLADFVAGEFAVAYPPCGPHLGATLSVLAELDTIGVDEVEWGYHEGHALPDAPDFCYHARDLVVHPASVIVLVREGGPNSRQQMLAEMLEALAHVPALRQLFVLASPLEPRESMP